MGKISQLSLPLRGRLSWTLPHTPSLGGLLREGRYKKYKIPRNSHFLRNSFREIHNFLGILTKGEPQDEMPKGNKETRKAKIKASIKASQDKKRKKG